MADSKSVDINALVAETEAAISSGAAVKAVTIAVSVPPVQDEAIRAKVVENALRSFEVVKEAQIQKLVEEMTEKQAIAAMKFVNKGLATCRNCNLLLKWHECLVEKNGLGIILSSMVDKSV